MKGQIVFDALRNLGNIGDLLGQARKLKEKMEAMQEELAHLRITADAGAGMVQATVNGKLELVKIEIDKTKTDTSDLEMLTDLITAAVRGAQTKAADAAKQQMEKVAGEMGLPPGMMGF